MTDVRILSILANDNLTNQTVMKRIFLIALLSVFALSCESDDATVVQPEQQQPPENENPEPNEPAQPVAIAFENVKKESFPRPIFPFAEGNFVLRNSTEWTAFLTHPTTNQVVSVGVEPDFSNYTYLVARHHYHTATNEDVDINIQSVTQFEGTITVKYIKTTYDEGDALLHMEEHPYHMVKIPATTLPVVLEQI